MRLPAGRSSTSTPSSPVRTLGLDEPEPALAAREERRGDLLEVLRDGLERLGEPALDRRRELGAERVELLEAALEVLALRLQVGEPLLLRLVLLAGKRVDLAQRHPPRLETGDARRELVAVVASARLDLACRLEPARRVARLGVDACDLHFGSRECCRSPLRAPGAGSTSAAPSVRSSSPSSPALVAPASTRARSGVSILAAVAWAAPIASRSRAVRSTSRAWICGSSVDARSLGACPYAS